MRARCKPKCCPSMQPRQIVRDVHEDARDVARRKMKTKAFLKSRDQRKRVEMRFAHLKTHHGFERMRLRGLSGARDEFHLAAIVQNLKTLALRLIRPPPPARLRVSCVASVCVASASRPTPAGARPKSPDQPDTSRSSQQPSSIALAADFFDSIDPNLPSLVSPQASLGDPESRRPLRSSLIVTRVTSPASRPYAAHRTNVERLLDA